MRRFWPALDRSLPPLGMGCWQLAGAYERNGRPHGFGPLTERDAVALVHHALDAGIVVFDTAAGYGDGESERRLGRALADHPQSKNAMVCTKVGVGVDFARHHSLGQAWGNAVIASAERLGRSIDMLLLHNPPDDIDWKRVDPAPLDALISEGVIGAYGVSARSLRGALNVAAARFGACVEWVLHLLERRPGEDLIPMLHAAGMSFIARSPLSRGLFSPHRLGRAPTPFASSDFRSTLDPDWVAWTRRTLDDAGFALRHDLAQTALRYSLSVPGVSAVIPGIRSTDQLMDAQRARALGPLSAPERQAIEARLPACYPPWAIDEG